MYAAIFRLFFMSRTLPHSDWRFEYLGSLALAHDGDCALLGITPELVVYVEESYGDDGWVAQHALRLDGTVLAQMDEQNGQLEGAQTLPLPADLIAPVPPRHTLTLNFSGPRWRGQRATDRIDEMVYPLPLADRVRLVERLGLGLPPPLLLGIAESRVLAETALSPGNWLVCRRVRLAYALPKQRHNSDGLPYDFDTLPLHLVHTWTASDDSADLLPDTVFSGLPGVTLRRPLDCLAAYGHVVVADGGISEHCAAVHAWRILAAN